jgi:hypothetical protein
LINQVTGKRKKFALESHATVEDLKLGIQDKEDIRPDEQRLVYGGKQLDDGRILAEYGVVEGSTIHLVLRSRGRPSRDVPTEGIHLADEKAQDVIDEWRRLAERDHFDADTHIVDPTSHHLSLKLLEHTIVTTSEFYRQSGQYNLDAAPGDKTTFPDFSNLSGAPKWLDNLVQDIQGNPREEYDSKNLEMSASLCKSYVIVQSIIERFDTLVTARFCTTFYSIIVLGEYQDIAEIIKIGRDNLVDFAEALLSFISSTGIACKTSRGRIDVEGTSLNSFWPALPGFLKVLGLSQSKCDNLYPKPASTLSDMYRVTASVLDLGLVSYVGGHGSRFDKEYLQRDITSLGTNSSSALNFRCGLRQLACLNGFLNKRLVWVFRLSLDEAQSFATEQSLKPKLSILTTIEALADIWGPVWAESISNKGDSTLQPTRVKKYHVAKGCVRRVPGRDPLPSGAILCHWYDWAGEYRRRFSRLLSGQTAKEEMTMSWDDKLVIGTEISPNQSCEFDLGDFESSYRHLMRDIGPKPSAWRFDGVSVALQLAAPKVVML